MVSPFIRNVLSVCSLRSGAGSEQLTNLKQEKVCMQLSMTSGTVLH